MSNVLIIVSLNMASQTKCLSFLRFALPLIMIQTKSPEFFSTNISKTSKCELFLATGFEFGCTVIALYFTGKGKV